MVADFNMLKIGFAAWLESKGTENNTKTSSNITSDVSIFANADAFKEYLDEKLNVDFNITSMSIGDILDMEIVNGKLVDESETDLEAQENDYINAENIFLSGAEGFDGFELSNNAQGMFGSEAGFMTVNGKQGMFGAEFGSMFSNGKQGMFGNEALSDDAQEMLITNILNELMSDETIQSIIDTDANSELSKDEVATFMNAIKGLDGNEDDISLSDIFSAIDIIKDNIFTKWTNKTVLPEAEETTISSTPTVSSNSSTLSSSRNNSTATNNISNTPSTTSNNNNVVTRKSSLDTMDLEELNEELETTQDGLTEQKTILSDTQNGSTPELLSLQEQVDEAYNAYKEQLELVDEDLAAQMEELEAAVDNAQADYDEKEQAVWEQEGVVNDCTTAYDNAVSKRENLEGVVSQLESTNTTDMSDEQKNALNEKIAEAKAQLEAAQTEENNAEEALDEAEKELEIRQEAYEKAGEELEKAKEAKTEFEQTLLEENAEIQTYLDAYNEAKNMLQEDKEKAIEEARKEVEVSENYVNEIKTEITQTENEEAEEEYKANKADVAQTQSAQSQVAETETAKIENDEVAKNKNVTSNVEYNEEEGQRLVETAKQMLEEYGSSTGWCATGVSRTISMAYGIEMHGNGCDWDTNMEKLTQKGMFTEVTDDYPTAGDLSNLPAGAVVCWENTGGTNGGGAQYGHVTIADGNGGEISDHYQANIYKKIGGRSDQYRIFIPV